MKINAFVKGKEIRYGSPLARERFMERAEGKYITITLDDKPTAEKRRYFEGCLVPCTFYAHPQSDWDSFADAREVLKNEFLPHKVINGFRGKIEVSKSTTDLSNKRFAEFIEAIVEWLRENRLVPEECLDPENYKAWRDSAPAVGETYPPLSRLKERYEMERGSSA